MAFDTHAAVRELRAGGFDEDQAEKLVDVFSRTIGTPVTKADLEPLATKSELAALEARLAWRLIGAGIAIAGIQAAAIVALLRLVLAPRLPAPRRETRRR